jgi:hypothetical protein
MEVVSNFAFDFNLRHYIKAVIMFAEAVFEEEARFVYMAGAHTRSHIRST